jgi:hypothetical protein
VLDWRPPARPGGNELTAMIRGEVSEARQSEQTKIKTAQFDA